MEDQEFPEIITGNGIDRDLAATTNDRLKKTVLELRLLKESIGDLKKSIFDLKEETSAYSQKLVWLTGALVVLTLGLIIATVLTLFRC